MSSSNNKDKQEWAEGSDNNMLLSGFKENNIFSELETDFNRIETVIDTLLAQPLSEIASRFPPAERARLYLLYAYCCNKLTSLYLEVNGEPETREILDQEKRVQESSNRVENTINPPQPSLVLNRSAATRFIMHSLPKEREIKDEIRREVKEEVRATSSAHTRFDDYSERRFSGSSSNDRRASGSSSNDRRTSGFSNIGSSPSDRRIGGFYNASSPSSDRRNSGNHNTGGSLLYDRISRVGMSPRDLNDRNYGRGYYDRDYNRDDRDCGDERPRKQKKKDRE